MAEPETAAELLAKIEAEHGLEAAQVAARFMDKEELPDRFRHNDASWKRTGKKAKRPPAIPATRSKRASPRDRADLAFLRKVEDGKKARRLPRSGAPLPASGRAPRDIENGQRP